MRSILQNEPPVIAGQKRGVCYLCMLEENDRSIHPLEEHHIFGGPLRKKSEEYGLKVYLCKKHHTGDIQGVQRAVHHPEYNDNGIKLKKIAQAAFEKEYSRGQFIQEFGRSYL